MCVAHHVACRSHRCISQSQPTLASVAGGSCFAWPPLRGAKEALSEDTGMRDLRAGGSSPLVAWRPKSRGKDTGVLTPEHFALQKPGPRLGGKALRVRAGLPSDQLPEQLLPLLAATKPALPPRGPRTARPGKGSSLLTTDVLPAAEAQGPGTILGHQRGEENGALLHPPSTTGSSTSQGSARHERQDKWPWFPGRERTRWRAHEERDRAALFVVSTRFSAEIPPL